MTFEVELGGAVRTVSVEGAEGPRQFRVTVDGAPQLLEVATVGEHGLSILRTVPAEKGTVTISRELQLVPGGASGEVLVFLQGRSAVVTINGRRAGRAADAGLHAAGDVSVAAPMPGRVVRVLVARGDDVLARQGLVVVEAMKMENELRAPRAGRVKEIAVTPGMSVDAGRILAVIE